MKVIKVDKDHNILNEDGMSAGFTAYGYNSPGFSYSILPLLFNLSQKGNDIEPSNKNKAYKHFVGELVHGISAYDNKKHKGTIKYLYFTGDDNETPTLVYIQDMKNNDTVPLKPDTIHSVNPPTPTSNVGTNYLGWGSTHIGYDNEGNYNVQNKMEESYDFNKSLIDFGNNKILKSNSVEGIDNFNNCQIGDFLYELNNGDPTTNEIGNPIAICVIEAGLIDNEAHFIYIKDIDLENEYSICDNHHYYNTKFPGIRYYKWLLDNDEPVYKTFMNTTNGWRNTEKILKWYIDCPAVNYVKSLSKYCYIPSISEVLNSDDNIIRQYTEDKIDIMSSTFGIACSYLDDDFNFDYTYYGKGKSKRKVVEDKDGLGYFICNMDSNDRYETLNNHLSKCGVLPFYNPYILKKTKKISESYNFNKSLIDFGNNKILKSNKVIGLRAYDFLNANIDDILYYDDILKFNLDHGKEVGICCVERGVLDDYPRFMLSDKLLNLTEYISLIYNDKTKLFVYTGLNRFSDNNEIIKTVDTIREDYYDSSTGYYFTRKLIEKGYISDLFTSYETYYVFLKNKLYLPTTYELGYALINGAGEYLDTFDKYLTSTCLIDIYDEDDEDDPEKLTYYIENEYIENDSTINDNCETIDDILNHYTYDEVGLTYNFIPFINIELIIDELSKKK